MVEEENVQPEEQDYKPEESPIEESVIAAQEEGPTVFDEPTPEEIQDYNDRRNRKGQKAPKQPKAPRPPRERPKFTWIKHIQSSISKGMGEIFDGMENEEV